VGIKLLKNIIILFIIITEFLFWGCINWTHVIEHNQLRAIEEIKGRNL
jgi:hypothetical protein